MKILKTLFVSLFIIIVLSQNVFALGNIFSKADSWENTGLNNANQTMDYYTLKTASDQLYNLLLAVATAVAVIVGAILGIQFMTAGIDQRVQVKQSLFPYLISCAVVFGSLGIWKLVVSIMSNL